MNNVIKKLVVTEKSTDLQEQGKYVFMVVQSANKRQIKDSVENEYNVDVVDVNTLNHAPRTKRLRGLSGRGKKQKKAIVTLAEGQSIALQ